MTYAAIDLDQLAEAERATWSRRERMAIDGIYRLVDEAVGLDGDVPATADTTDRVVALELDLALPVVEVDRPTSPVEARAEAERLRAEVSKAMALRGGETRARVILGALDDALGAFLAGMLTAKGIEPLKALGRRDVRVRTWAAFLIRCIDVREAKR